MKLINELVEQERINMQFLVNNAAKGTNAMGSQYITCELRDSSGTINGKKWEISPEDESIFVAGNVINVVGETLKYKEALQIKILKADLVPTEEIEVSRFLKQPPVPKEELMNRFYRYVESIKNPENSQSHGFT